MPLRKKVKKIYNYHDKNTGYWSRDQIPDILYRFDPAFKFHKR